MIRSAFLAAAVAAALAAGPPAAPAFADAPATAAPQAAVVVHIKNFAYDPATVTIKPGQAVQFINDDETPHTATAKDASFDSGNLDQKATWTHVFPKAGTYPYICTYHPYMHGTIVVQDAG